MNDKLYDCPKVAACNAPVCPLYAFWPRTRHLQSEPVCLWLRELAKDGGEVRLGVALPGGHVEGILDAYARLRHAVHPPIVGGGIIRRELQRAAKSGSKLAVAARLNL